MVWLPGGVANHVHFAMHHDFFVHTVRVGYTYSCVQHKQSPACHLRRLLRSLMRAIL